MSQINNALANHDTVQFLPRPENPYSDTDQFPRGIATRPYNPTQRKTATGEPQFMVSFGALPTPETTEPPADLLRGVCPDCGSPAVGNIYYGGRDGIGTERSTGVFLLRYDCWNALKTDGMACRWYTAP